jgi:precorrin-4/cobalt-precorrin-4 C11-methyltransferase
MKVYFIGAGPGVADLITVRGARILGRVAVVLYAGSLVSKKMLVHCRAGARIINTAKLSLDDQETHYAYARDHELDVARLHSGDPSIYGAIAEQMRRLDRLGIEYEVVPGVSSFVAAAALLNTELTKPETAQTIILTRTAGRASPMPNGESLRALAAHTTTMCVFLSGAQLPQVVAELLVHYRTDTPAVLVHKATWPQERIWSGSLGKIVDEIVLRDWELSTMLIVGEVLKREAGAESRLYAAEYSHRYRKSTGEAAGRARLGRARLRPSRGQRANHGSDGASPYREP